MIEHELILLGLLNESPKHGYEIKKKVKELLYLFSGINLKSIYYPLGVLEKKGFVAKRVDKQGRRPQRNIYELTLKGHVRFKELLSKSFLDFKRPQFSLDLCLYFLDKVEPKVVKRRLQARMVILKKLSKGLTQMIVSSATKPSSSLCQIIEHNLQMIEAESRFLGGLIQTLS